MESDKYSSPRCSFFSFFSFSLFTLFTFLFFSLPIPLLSISLTLSYVHIDFLISRVLSVIDACPNPISSPGVAQLQPSVSAYCIAYTTIDETPSTCRWISHPNRSHRYLTVLFPRPDPTQLEHVVAAVEHTLISYIAGPHFSTLHIILIAPSAK